MANAKQETRKYVVTSGKHRAADGSTYRAGQVIELTSQYAATLPDRFKLFEEPKSEEPKSEEPEEPVKPVTPPPAKPQAK